jgi:hypothetical protein
MNGNTFKGDFNYMLRSRKEKNGILSAQDIINEVEEDELFR